MKEEMFCSFFIRFWASAGPVSAASNASSPSPVGVAVAIAGRADAKENE